MSELSDSSRPEPEGVRSPRQTSFGFPKYSRRHKPGVEHEFSATGDYDVSARTMVALPIGLTKLPIESWAAAEQNRECAERLRHHRFQNREGCTASCRMAPCLRFPVGLWCLWSLLKTESCGGT